MDGRRTPDNCNLCGVALTADNWREYDRQKHSKRCRECMNARCRDYYHADPKRIGDQVIQNHRSLREQMIAAYGGKCSCCREATPQFLTLDHVNNNGAAHRKAIGRGPSILRWLRDRGWPKEGFQLLCWNCNAAKHYYKQCPHELRLRAVP